MVPVRDGPLWVQDETGGGGQDGGTLGGGRRRWRRDAAVDGTADAWNEEALEAERIAQIAEIEEQFGADAEVLAAAGTALRCGAAVLALFALDVLGTGWAGWKGI